MNCLHRMMNSFGQFAIRNLVFQYHSVFFDSPSLRWVNCIFLWRSHVFRQRERSRYPSFRFIIKPPCIHILSVYKEYGILYFYRRKTGHFLCPVCNQTVELSCNALSRPVSFVNYSVIELPSFHQETPLGISWFLLIPTYAGDILWDDCDHPTP